MAESYEIARWSELAQPLREDMGKNLREIFFLCSSRREFKSDQDKELFFDKWTKYYFANSPAQIYLARPSGRGLAGYLMGCEDSEAAVKFYETVNPSFALFRDLFAEFPAHLHINCHPDFHGRGVGRKLMEFFFADIGHLKGAHIVTSPEAENVRFYEKMGFSYQELRPWKTMNLLFMGKAFGR